MKVLVLSTLGLILGATGMVIGIVVLLHPKPFYPPFLGASVFLFSTAMTSYSIWSLISWNKKQEEELKNRILSDTSQLVAHWYYHLTRWESFYKIELKKEQQASVTAVWIFIAILYLIALLVVYLEYGLDYWVLIYTSLAALMIALLTQYWVGHHYRKKRNVFFNTSKPEIHLSTHGLLINHRWTIAFLKPGVSLIKVEKINLHQEVCLCFTVRYSSGEGDSNKKYNVPVPKAEIEHLPKVLAKIQK